MTHAFSSVVYVVDEDVAARESVERLIRRAGWQTETFGCAQEFLARPRTAGPCCLILDVILPDINGLDLQRQVSSERRNMPIIFLSGCCNLETSVKAMKAGALDFLAKPLNEDSLLSSVREAMKRSEIIHGREIELHQLRASYGSLTPREREVMTLVVSGLPNKQVGGELGISEITVKEHRGNVMRKMKADSFAHLVNMGARLRVAKPLTQNLAIA